MKSFWIAEEDHIQIVRKRIVLAAAVLDKESRYKKRGKRNEYQYHCKLDCNHFFFSLLLHFFEDNGLIVRISDNKTVAVSVFVLG